VPAEGGVAPEGNSPEPLLPLRLWLCSAFLCVLPSIFIRADNGPASAKGLGEKHPETVQCAHYAIYNVAAAYGIPIDLSSIKQLMPPQEGGQTLWQIKSAIESLGFTARGMHSSNKKMDSIQFPFVAHLADHFVVVTSADENGVVLWERINEPSIMRTEEFRPAWDGTYLEVMCESKEAVLKSLARLNSPAPALVFDSLVRNGGTIEDPLPSREMEFRFAFTNMSGRSVDIRRIRTGCKCTLGEAPPSVAPGDSAEIVVGFKAGAKIGPFMHRVFVETNDTAWPVVMLTLSGNIRRNIVVKPHYLDVASVRKGMSVERSLYLYCPEHIQSLTIERSSEDGPSFSAQVVPVTPELASALVSQPSTPVTQTVEHRYLVKLTVTTADLSEGVYDGAIQLVVNSPNGRKAALPYRVNVVPSYILRPRSVFMGLLKEGESKRGEVILRFANGEEFTIESTATDIPGMDIVFPTNGSQQHRIEYTYSTQQPVRTVDAEIRVSCSRSGSSTLDTIKIPVYGYAPGGG